MKGNHLAEFKRRFPHASADFINRNMHLFREGAGAPAELERRVEGGAAGTHQTQAAPTCRFRVCIKSVRRRLLDPDNISVKATLDAIRRAGIIPDDSPEHIDLVVSQRKAGPGEEEHTLIQVFELSGPAVYTLTRDC